MASRLTPATLMAAVVVMVAMGFTHDHESEAVVRPVSVRPDDITLDWQIVPPEGWVKVRASWYGPGFQGETRADGHGAYDMYEFSAAHVSLPFGTVLRLYNPENCQWVDVEINDSGPYNPYFLPPYNSDIQLRPHPNRQLDLSWAAADALGILDQGVADLWVVGSPGHKGPLFLDDLYADTSLEGNLRQ